MLDSDFCKRVWINDAGKRKHYKYLDFLPLVVKLHSLPPISSVGHNAGDLLGDI